MNYRIFQKFSESIFRGFRPELSGRIRPREIHLIKLIDSDPNEPMRFYAEHIGLEKGSFTYLVDVLEDKGLLNKASEGVDKRRKTLTLTDLGKEYLEDLKNQFDKYLEEAFINYTAQDKEDLKVAYETITRLAKKLPKAEKPRHHRIRPMPRDRHPHGPIPGGPGRKFPKRPRQEDCDE